MNFILVTQTPSETLLLTDHDVTITAVCVMR